MRGFGGVRALLPIGSALAIAAACGGDDGGGVAGAGAAAGSAGTDGGAGTGGSGGTSGSSGSSGTTGFDGGMECTEDCGDGTCIDGACCPPERACDSVCCGSGDVCSFGKCETPGGPCSTDEDCAQTEYCDPLLDDGSAGAGGAAGGGGACNTIAVNGRCLTKPPTCAPGTMPDPSSGSINCVASCEITPSADPFDFEQKYSWGMWPGGNSPPTDPAPPYTSDVRNAPIVIQLDDDDCDGKLTGRDIPEIVFTVSPDDRTRPQGIQPLGTLHAISVIGGQVVDKWSIPSGASPWSYLAAGNIDGKPGNEIVVCLNPGGVSQYLGAYTVDPFTPGAQPTLLWDNVNAACTEPVIGDLDQDGKPEVVTRSGIYNGVDGTLKHGFTDENGTAMGNAGGSEVVLSDIDVDGFLDVVSAQNAFDRTGRRFAAVNRTGTYAAVADLDDPPDGRPEVISIDFAGTGASDTDGHELYIWRYSATGGVEMVRENVDLNTEFDATDCPANSSGRTNGGGPPTIADVSGDGIPDIAVAGGVGYMVIDGAKVMDTSVPVANVFFWGERTRDCSSAQTGSAVFDFNGDGRAEVVYNDEQRYRIYNGLTGMVLSQACSSNATIREYPVVADVDNDGQADVIVASNGQYVACDDGSRQSGIRIFSTKDGAGVRTRRVWNQHSYHVTNVNEDGSIPSVEAPNWTQSGLNNFRQNKQPGSEFAAADLVVTLSPRCGSPYRIVATVRNLGEAPVPAGAVVELFEGTAPGTSLGTQQTTLTLYPAQAEQLEFSLGTMSPDLASGAATARATVTAPAGVVECRPDNNDSGDTDVSCQQVQ